MKKRFTLMMMVLCFLMSIPLKMMAETVTIHFVDEDGWSKNGGKICAYVYKGSTYLIKDWPGTECTDIKTVGGKNVATWTLNLGDGVSASDVGIVFNGNGSQYPAKGVLWKVQDGLYYYKSGKTSTTPPSEGGSTGSGGGSDTPVEWNTVTTNRLTEKPRVYTQGFYLAGDFFTFDKVDGEYKINYDDAVFKFQQQTDQDISIAKGAKTVYEVYKVDIPASLKAHAQVMYVDEFGNKKNIFGPGKCSISRTYPKTDESIGWLEATPDVYPITIKEIDNCWDFVSRNEKKDEYSDGMYYLYIAVEPTTHTVKKWKITHIADKRVAYIISDAPDAIAIPLYDTYKPETREKDPQFFNNFYGTVNFAANRSYYVISNYIYNNTKVDDAKDYGTIHDFYLNRIPSPTTNKLFLQGNGGLDYKGTYHDNLIFPNGAPLKVDKNNWGTQIVEYNPSRGDRDKCVFGFCGDLMLKNQRVVLNSVSLVGDAIPGTTNADGSWNYKSNIADMIYDETEHCYKATVVTTVLDDGQSKFRFVGNRDPKINWYENTDGSVPAEMAKHPHNSTDPNVVGHTADVNDPNKVNYTQDGANPEEDYHIIWNRPAGRWTVRLYFYTYSDGVKPVTEDYYTITESKDMVLHDVTDIVYDSETNKQNIYNKGEYKFLRTWSAKKTWKISNKVDVFVVNNVAEDESAVKLTLKNINKLDDTGKYHVIPANTGVILATKSDASDIVGARFEARQNYKSYNELVIPMEENGTVYEYKGKDNLLWPLYYSQVVPASDDKNFNYFFAYYNALIATNNEERYGASDYLLGFWISKGSKPYQSNSSYLRIPKEKAATLNRLGTSYDEFYTGGSAKKVPGVIFDFDNVGGTTGINEVVNQSTKLNDGKYYTLSGQQVEKPTAGGIYIHNGRKFVVK